MTRPVRRAAGQSAVAAAAYRSAERLFDDRRGHAADFRNRAADVGETFILSPSDAPEWTQNRYALWNAAEAAEKRKDGRPARDVTVGLAWELPADVRRDMVVAWASKEFVDKGHVVDVALHRYGQAVNDASNEGRATLRRWAALNIPYLERNECEGLDEPHVKILRDRAGDVQGYKVFQPHAHLLVTPRAVEAEGFAATRNRQFDRAEQAMEWRYDWQNFQNDYLADAGSDTRIRTTRADGAPPLRQETIEGVARHMEMRGEPATRARDDTEMAAIHNAAIRDAAAAEPIDAAEPESEGRFARVAAWWRNMNAHATDWGAEWRSRAQQTWDRFRGISAEPEEAPPDGSGDQGRSPKAPEHGDWEPDH